jgi:hypothetical protein
MVRCSRIGLATVPRGHSSVVRSRELMGHDKGIPWPSQDHREGCRAVPLKAMEGVLFDHEAFKSRFAALWCFSAT